MTHSLMQILFAAAALMSPAQSVVSEVKVSISEARARHAALLAPMNDRERLERMGELDQAPRRVITRFDFSTIPATERAKAIEQASAIIEAVDAENQAALTKLLPASGWFVRSVYGDKAATAAFHIVQHADLTLQERVLPVVAPLVAEREIDGQSYGLMFDRVAISRGRQQTYGTQFRCDGGKWRPYPIEDPEHLEERRATLSFPRTYAEMKAYFDNSPPCPQTLSPPPQGMKLD